jgi:hypothetical protein
VIENGEMRMENVGRESPTGEDNYPTSCFAYKNDTRNGCDALQDRLCAREKRCYFYKTEQPKTGRSGLPSTGIGAGERSSPLRETCKLGAGERSSPGKTERMKR